MNHAENPDFFAAAVCGKLPVGTELKKFGNFGFFVVYYPCSWASKHPSNGRLNAGPHRNVGNALVKRPLIVLKPP
jgi:hypothetical protein